MKNGILALAEKELRAAEAEAAKPGVDQKAADAHVRDMRLRVMRLGQSKLIFDMELRAHHVSRGELNLWEAWMKEEYPDPRPPVVEPPPVDDKDYELSLAGKEMVAELTKEIVADYRAWEAMRDVEPPPAA